MINEFGPNLFNPSLSSSLIHLECHFLFCAGLFVAVFLPLGNYRIGEDCAENSTR